VYFQQKCFDRIRKFTADGTTLLFVTHSLSAVLDSCTRAIYLKGGGIALDGEPKASVDLFEADILGRLDRAPERIEVIDSKGMVDESETTDGAAIGEQIREGLVLGRAGSIVTRDADCTGVRLLDRDGRAVHVVLDADPVTLEVSYRLKRDLDDPHVGFKIRNRQGVVMFETNTFCMGRSIGRATCGQAILTTFTFRPSIPQDEYTVTVGLGNRGFGGGSFEEVVSYLHEVFSFSVMRAPASAIWSGLVNLHPTSACVVLPARS